MKTVLLAFIGTFLCLILIGGIWWGYVTTGLAADGERAWRCLNLPTTSGCPKPLVALPDGAGRGGRGILVPADPSKGR